MRRFLILILPMILLAGCERQYADRAQYAPAMMRLAAPPPNASGENQSFSYSHNIVVETSHKSVDRRFERARDLCLHDARLRCKLLSSSIDSTGYAQIDVALPHDMVAPYENSLTSLLPGEATSDATVTSRTTTAQNVSQDEADANRKAAQLSDYRDRLQALAKRPGLSVDDLLKIESELSKTQSELDDALSQKNGVEDRLTREQVSATIVERVEPRGPFDQVGSVAGRSIELFGESTANALQFLIQLVPWLPIIGVGFLLIRWLWRIAQRRRSVARSRPE